AQEARGARVVHVGAAADGTIPYEQFERVVDDDTLIVSITHVCYRNGSMIDVPKVVELAHERGALVLLDAFQSVGSLPVDVRELASHLIEGLDELRAKLATPRRPKRRGALICVKSTDSKALVAALGREGIVTSERDGNLRISAHCYNSVEDVDAVLASLQR